MKTVRLQTAKLLKEAGFPQNTTWYWHFNEVYGGNHINLHNDGNNCAAPTTDELLEELPDTLNYNKRKLRLHITRGIMGKDHNDKIIGRAFQVFYGINAWNELTAVGYKRPWIDKYFICESLPEALAQMYLWLKKEGLI